MWQRFKYWLTGKEPSNAWNFDHAGDEKGMWERKEPFGHEVVDSFGNRITIWRFPRSGMRIQSHAHTYGHDSHLVQGTVIVTGDREGRNGIPVTGPDTLFFDAGVPHSIKALSKKVILIHTYKPGEQITDNH